METRKEFACSQCNFSTTKEKKLVKHISKTHAVVGEGAIVKTSESRKQKKSLDEERDVSKNKIKKRKRHQATIEVVPGDEETYVSKAKKQKSSGGTIWADKAPSDTSEIAANMIPTDTVVTKSESYCRKESMSNQSLQTSTENKENDSACASSPVLVTVIESNDEVTLPQEPKRKRHSSKSVSETKQKESAKTQYTGVLTCPFCKPRIKTFGSIKELSEHKKCEHKDVKLNCCFCDFSSSYLRKWHNHLHSAHPQSIGPVLQIMKKVFQQIPEA